MKKWWLVVVLLLPFALNAQIITTIAGGGVEGNGSPATAAAIFDPAAIFIDQHGNIYFTESLGHRARKIDNLGIISTIAGTGTAGFSGDGGSAIAARLNEPTGITLDSLGNIFISDGLNSRIRKIDAVTGIITTVIGNAFAGFTGDGGMASAASIFYPGDICFDRHGNLYFTDNANNRVRKVDAGGIISTVAGNGIVANTGDNGPATAAGCIVSNMCVDSIGNIFVSSADGSSNQVRKVNTMGIITTLAGDTSAYLYNGDDILATNAHLAPMSIAVRSSGESGEQLYITDLTNNRIRMIDELGIIHTVAGNGTAVYSGDGGAATSGGVSEPSGITFDRCGNLYIAQVTSPRIRKVTYPGTLTTPTISLTGIVSAPLDSTVTVTATIADAGSSYVIYWMNNGVEFTTTTTPSVTYTKGAGTDIITAELVPIGCYDIATSGPHMVSVFDTTSNTSVGLFNLTGLSIYPNPAIETIYMDGLQTAAGYRLLSIVGNVVQQGNLSVGSNSISVQQLSPGMYMLEIRNEDGEKMVRKIVKQ